MSNSSRIGCIILAVAFVIAGCSSVKPEDKNVKDQIAVYDDMVKLFDAINDKQGLEESKAPIAALQEKLKTLDGELTALGEDRKKKALADNAVPLAAARARDAAAKRKALERAGIVPVKDKEKKTEPTGS